MLPAFIAFAVVVAVVVQFWYVAAAIAAGYVGMRIVRHIRKERYFASEEFISCKRAQVAVVSDHNEVAIYAAELRKQGAFTIGAASTGLQSHLATWDNTSRYNYRRDRNVANFQARNVHNCSLQVVRNASADPIKYGSHDVHVGS